MKALKNIFIVVFGSLCTFIIIDYTLGEKTSEKYFEIKSINNFDDAKGLDRTFSHGQVDYNNLVAMNTQKTVDFYRNTYDDKVDINGKPQLKRGKRFYNEQLMEAISTSANIEPITRGDE